MNDIISRYPQGYWQVNDKKFINKYEALSYGVQIDAALDYHYFDNVWQSFDRTLLNKYTLNELYKQRAKQLRDKYDYLILYFSGGADSYNVLRSFIDNDIKLDEICVKWCVDSHTANTKIYTPNTVNLDATNYISEWDYAIKPVLEEISISNPEIKIQIVDWFKDRDEKTIETAFNKVNHWHDYEINSLAIWSPSEFTNIEQGKTVGSIYGVDKPAIYYENKKAYLYFSDSAMAMGTPNDININGTEYFYYSPDFPLLLFQMAFTVIKEYNNNENLQNIAITSKTRHIHEFVKNSSLIYQRVIRNVLYNNWTDRFQTLKPIIHDRSDKHNWIYTHKELARYREMYNSMINDRINHISTSKHLLYEDNQNLINPIFYKAVRSKKHYVCDVDFDK